MRILFLSTSGHMGGAERSMLDLQASLRAHPSAPEIGMIAGGDGDLLEESAALGVQVIRLPLGGHAATLGDGGVARRDAAALATFGRNAARAAGQLAAYARRLRVAIREFRPSVVHSNGIKMHLLGAGAGLGDDVPLVWHLRDFVGDRWMASRALRAVGWRASAGIAISAAVAANARRILRRLPLPVIYDGIDTQLFTPEGPAADLDALSGAAPAPTHCVRIGLVATYARWKGHDVFLEAARRFRDAAGAPDARFYIVGGPIYEADAAQYRQDELQAMVARWGLKDAVRFVPFQRRVAEVYRGLDVVVHASSRPEPFGRTIAEAMATGKAVIATADGGASEIFADGTEAVGVPPRAPDALASAMRRLAGDPGARARLGPAARAGVVARFSRARLAEQVLRVYSEAGWGDGRANRRVVSKEHRR